MKNLIPIFIGFVLLHCSFTNSGNNNGSINKATGNNLPEEQSIRILCTPDLYPLSKTFAGEYVKIHPEVQIAVVRVSGFQKTEGLDRESDLSLVSDEYFAPSENDLQWKINIGREVIVPVISSKNPFIDKINKRGIRPDELAQLIKYSEKQIWGKLLGNDQSAPVHFYIVRDESLKSQVAYFIGTDPVSNHLFFEENREDMISALQKDPCGIGFCRMTDLVDRENQGTVGNLTILSFDKNKNGQLDNFEKINKDLNTFARGVWIGKYPESLCRNIYFFSSSKPENATKIAFLTWMITDGQKYLYSVGYKEFTNSGRHAADLAMLKSCQADVSIINPSGLFAGKLNGISIFSLVLLVLTPFVLIFMVTDAWIRDKQQSAVPLMNDVSYLPSAFDENSVVVPKGLFFDKSHMWAYMEQNGLVRIGIGDFLQHITGPLTSIKMRDPGEKVQKGEQLISIIQNGKHLTINAPVSGVIKAQNTALSANITAINRSPYSEGWIYMIEPTKWLSEIRFLTMAEMYKEWLTKEFARLKDFFAASLKANTAEYAQISLQDGGALKDGILADLGPMAWEDFQTNFIEKSK